MDIVSTCQDLLSDGQPCEGKSIRVKGRRCRSCHNWFKMGNAGLRSRYVKRSGSVCNVVFANGRSCVREATLATGFCESCNRWSRANEGADPNGRPYMRGNGERLAELSALVKVQTDDCIDFEGNTDVRPAMNYGGLGMNTPRVAWFLTKGDPGDLFVLHTCHRGREGCVNPRHLYLGTATDNVRDMCQASRCIHWGRHDH